MKVHQWKIRISFKKNSAVLASRAALLPSIFLIVFTFQGCDRLGTPPVTSGEHGSSLSQSQVAPVVTAEILDLKVVPEAEPGQAAEIARALDLDLTAHSDEIQIHTKLGLRDLEATEADSKRDLFFTWPDQFRGKQIVSARYTHRVQETSRGAIFGLNTHQARPDREARRMLIPFSEIFENLPDYPEVSADPDHHHFLELEMTLQGGELARVLIFFQATGPLPRIGVESLPLRQLGAREKAQSAAGPGLELTRESLVNPVNRPLRIWLKASTQPISLWHSIHEPVYRVDQNRGAYVETALRGSQGQLQVREVGVLRSSGEVQTVRLDHAGVGLLELGPRERVELTWKAMATVGTRFCFLPERSIRDWTWTSPAALSHPFLGGGGMPSISVHRRIELVWEMVAAELEGQWTREIRVAHPFTLREYAVGDVPQGGVLPVNAIENYRMVQNQTQNAYADPQIFDRRAMIASHFLNCQGLFP